MALIEKGFRRRSEVVAPISTFDEMEVMGATGKIGRLWLDRAIKSHPDLPLIGIVRHFDKRLDPFPTVRFTDDIGTVLK